MAIALLTVLVFAFGRVPTLGDAPAPTKARQQSLTDLSIEQLMNVEVTSVSRRAEKLSETPAAVYVITQEDIRRSGLTNVPDLLRMVPGMAVANINAHGWAITARGFNSRFSNKLLVLMDGRSVYCPLYSGVWWDTQDLALDDIDRIEVIRGPGATLWGANAVNGIINVVTKNASAATDRYANALTGEQGSSIAQMAYTGRTGSAGHYRFYAKNRNEGGFVDWQGSRLSDMWNQTRCGFRFESAPSEAGSLTLQSTVYRGGGTAPARKNLLAPPYSSRLAADIHVSGGDVLARWARSAPSGVESTLQLYCDQAYRDDLQYVETRNTYDLDFQQQLPTRGRHDLIWGMGYRHSVSDTQDSEWTRFDPESRITRLASAFLQDEITLRPDREVLTIGSKLEYDNRMGVNIQPSLRMLWTPPGRGTTWIAVSRAVRTPCRAELSGWLSFRSMPSQIPQMAQLLTLNGNPDFRSEKVLAYEIGHRTQPTDKFSLDVTAFYNLYDKLRTLELGTPHLVTSPVPHIEVPLIWDNKMSARSCGLEIAANWQPKDNWRLALAYTYLNVSTRLAPDSTATLVPEGYDCNAPPSQIVLRSYFDLPGGKQLDAALYCIGGFDHHSVPGYTRLDLRYAWHLKDGTEVSLVGQNLLQSRHQEFYGILNEDATEVPRTFYVRMSRGF